MVEKVEIGDATLYCGDCLEVLPTLGRVDAVVTDPPYSSGGQFRGDRMQRTASKYQGSEHRNLYADFSGDNRDQRSYGYWSALWVGACRQISKPGSILGMFTDWRQLPTTTDAFQAGGYIWRGIVVWDKTEAARPQKGRYRGQCEYMIWGSNGPMSEDGPCAPGVFRHSAGADKEHIAGKPIDLMKGILQLVPHSGTVLDPFMGSGTTGIAAMCLNLKFIGIEIEPKYFDIACERIAKEHAQPRFELVQRAPAPEQMTML